MTAQEIQKQYLKEHPEREGETDKEFALTNYIEWLENKVINYNSKNCCNCGKDVFGTTIGGNKICRNCGKPSN